MAKKIYRLSLKDDLPMDYWIAIHTNIEAHQVAFYLNQNTNVFFKRSRKNLKNELFKGEFILFEWDDLFSDDKCRLISNKCTEQNSGFLENKNTLFDLQQRNEVYLFLEFKKSDFFIKSSSITLLKNIKDRLKSWHMVTMVYDISSQKIKSQLNINF